MPAADGSHLLVSPGDFIIADRDGAVVIPGNLVQQIVEDAETLTTIEAAIVVLLEQGVTCADAFARHPRFAHVRSAL